jgi:phosphatidylserine decarboxylase
MVTTLLYTESPLLGGILTILPIATYYFNYARISIALFILLLFMLFFYRYYPHYDRYKNNVVVSPADGTVTNIRTTKTHCYISIFLSPINIHTQIYPVNGTVISRQYDRTGKFGLATDIDKCRNNEKKIHTILMNNNRLLRITQIAGFLPRRITSSDKVPEQVLAGEYLGMIKFGSRVDLLFPISYGFVLQIQKNQSITIGDIIGQY